MAITDELFKLEMWY